MSNWSSLRPSDSVHALCSFGWQMIGTLLGLYLNTPFKISFGHSRANTVRLVTCDKFVDHVAQLAAAGKLVLNIPQLILPGHPRYAFRVRESNDKISYTCVYISFYAPPTQQER